MYLKIFVFLLFCGLRISLLHAQNTGVQGLKVEAEALFVKKDYVAATPKFLQLLSLEPKDPTINFKYGVCLLFNATDKSKAVPFLEYAVASQTVSNDCFYFLAKAYHLSFEFSKALAFYEKYQKSVKLDPAQLQTLLTEIEQCKNGSLMTQEAVLLTVLERKDVLEKEFYRHYQLKDIGGDILISGSDQTKTDKKNNFTPIIYYPPNPKYIFFASYGNGNSSKDLYVKEKLASGAWSEPRKIDAPINSEFDEDFPYFDAEEQLLYFSSNGPNSIGGYDVFKAKFDPVNNKVGVVENLDFPISSPDNDLFFIYDAKNRRANFASSRQSANGNITIYSVVMTDLPKASSYVYADLTAINKSERLSYVLQLKKNGSVLGTFSPSKDGKYVLPISEDGTYQFEFTNKGTSEHSVIEVQLSKDAGQKLLQFQQLDGGKIELEKTLINPESTAQQLAKVSTLEPNTIFSNSSISSDVSKADPVTQKQQWVNQLSSKISELQNEEQMVQKLNGWILENDAKSKVIQSDLVRIVELAEGTKKQLTKNDLLKSANEKLGLLDQLNAENDELSVYREKIKSGLSNNQQLVLEQLKEKIIQQEQFSSDEIQEMDRQMGKLETSSEHLFKTQLIALHKSIDLKQQKLTANIAQLTKELDVFEQDIQADEKKLLVTKEKDKNEIIAQITRKTEARDELLSMVTAKKVELSNLTASAALASKQIKFINELSVRNDKVLLKEDVNAADKIAVDNQELANVKRYLLAENNIVQQEVLDTLQAKNTSIVVAPEIKSSIENDSLSREKDAHRADIDFTFKNDQDSLKKVNHSLKNDTLSNVVVKNQAGNRVEDERKNELALQSKNEKESIHKVQVNNELTSTAVSIQPSDVGADIVESAQTNGVKTEVKPNESIIKPKQETPSTAQVQEVKSTVIPTTSVTTELAQSVETNDVKTEVKPKESSVKPNQDQSSTIQNTKPIVEPSSAEFVKSAQHSESVMVRNSFYSDFLAAANVVENFQLSSGEKVPLTLIEIGPTEKLKQLQTHFAQIQLELTAIQKNAQGKDSFALVKELKEINVLRLALEKELIHRTEIYAKLKASSGNEKKNLVYVETFENAIIRSNELVLRKSNRTAAETQELSTLFSLIRKSSSYTGNQLIDALNPLIQHASNIVENFPATSIQSSAQALTISTTPFTQDQKVVRNQLQMASSEKGLVYRIQIGAFAKDIPEAQFDAFKPLTGEVLANRITRYMTGYFSNRLTAINAQKLIREMGYKDAFVVAYCDGKRISVAQAMTYEQNQLCIGTGKNELLIHSKTQKEAAQISALAGKDGSQSHGIQTVPNALNKEDEKQFFQGMTAVDVPVEIQLVELVSEKTYQEEPIDLLAQLNREGSFYYDASSEKVKSFPLNSTKNLPMVKGFTQQTIADTTLIISTVLKSDTLNGGFVDWLSKHKIPYELVVLTDGLELRLITSRELADKYQLTDVLEAHDFEILK